MDDPLQVYKMDANKGELKMTKWIKRISVKHLFTEEEDHKSIQESMNKVADTLEKEGFPDVVVRRLRNIPKENAITEANRRLSSMFDYADRNRIWIE